MRIISQDGWFDISYEDSILYIEEKNRDYIVAALTKHDKTIVMATYAFEQLAKIALEEIRNNQFSYKVIQNGSPVFNTTKIDTQFYQFPTNEECMEKIKNSLNG